MPKDSSSVGGTSSSKKDDGNSNITIPDEVKEKYPELIPQILASRSMDDDERNYWFSVLPIMTDEQVAELRDILDTEQKRLKKASGKDVSHIDLEKTEAERRERMEKRKSLETDARLQDHDDAEGLLSELDSL